MKLQEAFKLIPLEGNPNIYIVEICKLISEDKLEKSLIKNVLTKCNVVNIDEIKVELLDLILSYIRLILNDDILTTSEENDVRLLKLLFNIDEGDFIKYRNGAITEILKIELQLLYKDKQINDTEVMKESSLQRLFDLSYDQFLEIVNVEDIKALEKGAKYDDLQTFIKPKNLK